MSAKYKEKFEDIAKMDKALVTFSLLGKIHDTHVKGGKVYFDSKFVETSVHN